MSKTIEVFICTNCGYEDSSFMPIKYKNKQLGICPSCNCNVTVNIESIEISRDKFLKMVGLEV